MRISIHYKIALIFISVIAAILAGVYFYLNASLTDYTYQRIRGNLIKQAALAATLLEDEYGSTEKAYELDEMADWISADLGVRATIIGSDGTVYGDSDLDRDMLLILENHLHRPEVQDALQTGLGVATRFSTTVKKNMLYVAKRFGRDTRRGIVRLSIPLSEAELISSRLKRLLVVSLGVAFFFSILISLAVSALISRPIRDMAWITQAIARDSFSKKVTVTSNDEIGELARAINYMTEQIETRMEEVIASRSRLEAVLLSMFEGVMVLDAQGTILLMNKRLRDFLRIDKDPTGRKPLEVIRNIEVQEIADRSFRLETGLESKEVTLLVPDEKILSIHATPVVRDAKTEGAVLVFYDITELRHLEKIRKDFVANVSHELRTPTSNIKGYAETLLDGALDDRKNAKDFVDIIYNDAMRLEALINDLLDLSKLESGKIKLSLQKTHIRPLTERVIASLRQQTDAKSIQMRSDISEAIPPVKVDEAMIIQVLVNLITNAIKYTPQGGSITLSCRDLEDFIQVDVADTGIGIPEEDLPRIFERFYRVDKARSRELGGTGLGLSIVKHIIQSHGGDVFVSSVVSQGSTFSFTIPKA